MREICTSGSVGAPGGNLRGDPAAKPCRSPDHNPVVLSLLRGLGGRGGLRVVLAEAFAGGAWVGAEHADEGGELGAEAGVELLLVGEGAQGLDLRRGQPHPVL